MGLGKCGRGGGVERVEKGVVEEGGGGVEGVEEEWNMAGGADSCQGRDREVSS